MNVEFSNWTELLKEIFPAGWKVKTLSFAGRVVLCQNDRHCPPFFWQVPNMEGKNLQEPLS